MANGWATMTNAEYDRLNPPTPVAMLMDDGLYFRALEDERWLPVGYIPRPRTRMGWFTYHLIHGLAMRYRFWPVLLYSLRETLGNGDKQ